MNGLGQIQFTVAKNSPNEPSNGAAPLPEAAPAPKRSTKTPKAPATKSAVKRTAAKVAAKKAAPRRVSRKKEAYEPSDNEIRIRAYFIAERRAQMELEGDPSKDWLEARKQLLEEAQSSKAE